MRLRPGAPNGVQNDQVKVNGLSTGLVRIAFAEDEAEEVPRGSGAVSLPYRRHTNIAADRFSNWMHTTIISWQCVPRTMKCCYTGACRIYDETADLACLPSARCRGPLRTLPADEKVNTLMRIGAPRAISIRTSERGMDPESNRTN